MPILLTCACGRRLRAQDGQVGKRVRCPACNQALVVSSPEPASPPPPPGWTLDSADAAELAEQAGLLQRGRGAVLRAHADEPPAGRLLVEGTVGCWNCRLDVPFDGSAFGRAGLAGALTSLVCPRCRAQTQLGYAALPADDGLDLLLVAPSPTRGHRVADDAVFPTPRFVIRAVRLDPEDGATPADDDLDHQVAEILLAVQRRAPRPDLTARLARLVQQHATAEQAGRVGTALGKLLRSQGDPAVALLLAEALACLRVVEAGAAVHAALRRLREGETPPGPAFEALRDLALFALLFGDRAGFLEARDLFAGKGMPPTRACHLGKNLSPDEVVALAEEGRNIAACASTLGGAHWQQVLAFQRAFENGQEETSSLLGRVRGLFAPRGGQGEAVEEKTGPVNEEFAAAVRTQFSRGRVDTFSVRCSGERAAQTAYRRLLADARHERGLSGVLVLRGMVADAVDTGWFVGMVCRHAPAGSVRRWLQQWAADLPLEVFPDEDPRSLRLLGGLCSIAEFCRMD